MEELKGFNIDFQKVLRSCSVLHKIIVRENKYLLDLVDITSVDKIVLPRAYRPAFYWRDYVPIKSKNDSLVTVDDFNNFEIVDVHGKGRVRISFVINDVINISVHIANEKTNKKHKTPMVGEEMFEPISNIVLSKRNVKNPCIYYWQTVDKLPYDVDDLQRIHDDHATFDMIKDLSKIGASVMTTLYTLYNFSDKFVVEGRFNKEHTLEYIESVRKKIMELGEDILDIIETMAFIDAIS
jgi:hypothetical protein